MDTPRVSAPPAAASRRAGPAARLGGAISFWYIFTRFPVMGASVLIPLLGAASVNPRPSLAQVAALIGVGVAFHCYAYVLNDVIDLPVDRTEPLRAACPLVKGTVSRGQALAFAGLMVPLALALTAWQAAPARAYLALGASFVLMTAYDLWGKRTRFPPLTDLVQALSWGAYALYGATVMPGPFNHLTAIVVAFIIVYILLVNGVHGSLRDLKNDHACGMRSTALLLGARTRGEGVSLPRSLLVYTLLLQAGLTALTLLPLIANDLAYSPRERALTALAVLAITALALYWLRAAARQAEHSGPMIVAGAAHIALLLAGLVSLFALRVAPGLLAAMIGVYVAPLLLHREILEKVRRKAGRWLAGGRAAEVP